MLLLKTRYYLKRVAALPKKDKVLLLAKEKLLTENPFHSQLHTKKLKGFPSASKVYSFRITRSYRGIFRFSNEDIVLFAIGHRKDIYQSLND